MNSKAEAILKDMIIACPITDVMSLSISAMQTYAAGFAEWIDMNPYIGDSNGQWYNSATNKYYTTTQLLHIFDQS